MKLASIILAAAALAASAVAAHGAEYVVQMKFNEVTGQVYFDKPRLTIKPGDTVTWVQADPANEHNVVAYPDRIPEGANPFASPLMKKAGERWSMTFAREGTYDYHCHPHEAAAMRGTVVVGRESGPEEFRKLRPGEMQHDHGAAGHGAAGHGGHDTHGQPALSGAATPTPNGNRGAAPGAPAHSH